MDLQRQGLLPFCELVSMMTMSMARLFIRSHPQSASNGVRGRNRGGGAMFFWWGGFGPGGVGLPSLTLHFDQLSVQSDREVRCVVSPGPPPILELSTHELAGQRECFSRFESPLRRASQSFCAIVHF